MNKLSDSSNDVPNILLLNATSLAKNNAVQHLQCDLASNNIDIALIVETWFTRRIVNNVVAIRNYNLFRVDRTKRNCGGIAAYVKEELTVKLRYNGLG